jgi:hypothetical protein
MVGARWLVAKARRPVASTSSRSAPLSRVLDHDRGYLLRSPSDAARSFHASADRATDARRNARAAASDPNPSCHAVPGPRRVFHGHP